MNELLTNYIPVADMLAETFGSDCEVVIHDLTKPQESVVYTVNNHVTGREIGQSFDHIITQVLLNQNFSNDYSANYYFMTEDSKLIKSSTSLIKDTENKVVGALCINIDTKKEVKDIQAMNFSIEQLQSNQSTDIQSEVDISEMEHIEEIAEDLIDRIIGDVEIDQTNRNEKINLIRFMEDKGVFLIKGAIDKVASKLGVSTVTIYSYLDEIKKSDISI